MTDLNVICHHCGYTFGEHCAQDDACPMYYVRPSGHKHHAGFDRTRKFLNIYTPKENKSLE